MCGIFGYIGNRKVMPLLIQGIKQLEHRGYDSSGTAVIEGGKLKCVKACGKVDNLEEKIDKDFTATIGISHTRWATHGAPSEKNAHPHIDCRGKIAVVHNGVIENYNYLKEQLQKEGHVFRSETDTEVIVHLIEKYLKENLESAVRKALKKLEGAYGIAVISADFPEKIIAARRGSPVIIGVGKKEYFIGSDISALIHHTKKLIYLEDNEMVSISKKSHNITNVDNLSVKKKIETVSWNVDMVQKGGFEHFMLKEIHEQPQTIKNALLGRIEKKTMEAHLGGIREKIDKLVNAKRIIICACGTSWHAGLVGEYIIEKLCKIPVEVEYASEFRYRDPVLDKDCVIIAISQSGETADTLAALRQAKKEGVMTLGICNVVGSSIARETDAGIYTHAGPEIGVASTKAFTSQLVVLYLLAILLAGRRGTIHPNERKKMINELMRIPEKVEKILVEEKEIKKIARLYYKSENFLYLGRGYNFPIALEGALKLKEISYIHAEGYPAAEMKHGPIALINENMPVVFIAVKDSSYEKILSNIAEVKARKGRVIAIATEDDKKMRETADHVLYIPKTSEFLTPILSVIPLQLLAYYTAVLRGCDVDRPRNLAKSVTVE
ncbi:MAG: glutamine--fructose-6-phosphate transaminase (isomerizing) [Candidatus Omnitrophota bacterium]